MLHTLSIIWISIIPSAKEQILFSKKNLIFFQYQLYHMAIKNLFFLDILFHCSIELYLASLDFRQRTFDKEPLESIISRNLRKEWGRHVSTCSDWRKVPPLLTVSLGYWIIFQASKRAAWERIRARCIAATRFARTCLDTGAREPRKLFAWS